MGCSTISLGGLGMMLIIVTTLTATFVVDVEDSDSIDNVKAKIFAEYEIPPDQQSLIYAGKRLTSGTVNNYNICDYDTIVCVTPTVVWTRRVGGMYQLLS